MPFGPWLKKYSKIIFALTVLFVAALLFKIFFAGGLLSASKGSFTSGTYFLTQTHVIPFEHFKKLLFPFNLNIDVDFPIFSDWTRVTGLTGILALGLYMAVWFALSNRSQTVSVPYGGNIGGSLSPIRRVGGFSMAWILITLLPTSSLVPLLDVTAEHRAYLPMVGFSFLLAALYCKLIDALRKRTPPLQVGKITIGPLTAPGTLLTILVLFAVVAMDRSRIWKSDITLWADAKKKSPNIIRPYNNLGEAYDKKGEWDKAIVEFEAALKLNSRYFFALNNLGNIYGKKQQYDKAIEYFMKALEQNPEYAPAYYNMAKAMDLTVRKTLSMDLYRKAIVRNPYFEQAFFNLAYLALQLQQWEEAVENFKKFIAMQPKNSKAHFGLANAYILGEKIDLAMAEYQAAAQLDPMFLAPQITLANIYLKINRVDDALTIFEGLIKKFPEFAGIHKNLGIIYGQHKQSPQKALHHFSEYLRLAPNDPEHPMIKAIMEDLKRELTSSFPDKVPTATSGELVQDR